MSNEISEYDNYDHNNYNFQDDYDNQFDNNHLNSNLESCENSIMIQNQEVNSNSQKIHSFKNIFKNNFKKETNVLEKEKNNNFDLLNKKEFSTKNKQIKNLHKNENNKNHKNFYDVKSFDKNEILINQDVAIIKPDYANWSEDRLKEEMKCYGIRPTSIKNMIKHLCEIWDFFNLSTNYYFLKILYYLYSFFFKNRGFT